MAMIKKIRVLVADDSFFMRKVLRELLGYEFDIEVVGEAKDGAEAVKEAIRLKPNVITMDYNMPIADGAVATEEIMRAVDPPPAVIMLSAYAQKDAEATLKVLRAGAVDFILKPSGEVSVDLEKIKDELIAKIRAAAEATVKKYPELQSRLQVKKEIPAEIATKIVVIGASTGGPPLLENLIAELPTDLKAAVVVVQHMPAGFTRIFADRLNRNSKILVKEAEEGDLLRNGMVFVAPGDLNMTLSKAYEDPNKKIVHLSTEPADVTLRPSIDIFMMSAAHQYPRNMVSVLLTGMGDDGVEGLRGTKTIHGSTIAQDPSTAAIPSMPRAAIKEKLADEILKPDQIVNRLVQLVNAQSNANGH